MFEVYTAVVVHCLGGFLKSYKSPIGKPQSIVGVHVLACSVFDCDMHVDHDVMCAAGVAGGS